MNTRVIVAVGCLIVYLLVAGMLAQIYKIDKKKDKYDENFIIYTLASLWPITLIALPFGAIAYVGYWCAKKLRKNK